MLVTPSAPITPLPLHRLALCLAEMTALRDRDQLQARLVDTLTSSFQPRRARVCRRPEALGHPLNEWTLHPLPVGEADTDALTDDPPGTWQAARHQALSAEQPVMLGEAPCRAFYPLVTDRGTDAVLELLFDHPPHGEHQLMADQMLRIYRNLIGLLDYSERDSLTGLLNRKTFDETFMRMTGTLPTDSVPISGEDGRRHWQADDPCWLAVIDIDHFKQVNDRHGHLVGDEVLLLVARLMNETLRHRDRLYRFGGEEFVVLMRCAHADGARTALERLRRRVADELFPQVGHLTISIGFTRVDADDTPEQAFGRADRAVYAAKDGGRDQVRDHAELLAEGGVTPAAVRGGIDFF